MSSNDDSTDLSSFVIFPGKSVGRISLGLKREEIIKLLPPKPNVDQESLVPDCGFEYLWVDVENPRKGNVIIRLEDSTAYQIEVSSNRFKTENNISTDSSATEIRKSYPHLRVYTLNRNTPDAFGGKPLIFWIDWVKGIAFTFATERRSNKKYLYSITIFRPNGKFCPNGNSTNSSDWKEL